MTAMDAAVKNAQDMLEEITIEYNNQRQSEITASITEISGGVVAMKAEAKKQDQ